MLPLNPNYDPYFTQTEEKEGLIKKVDKFQAEIDDLEEKIKIKADELKVVNINDEFLVKLKDMLDKIIIDDEIDEIEKLKTENFVKIKFDSMNERIKDLKDQIIDYEYLDNIKCFLPYCNNRFLLLYFLSVFLFFSLYKLFVEIKQFLQLRKKNVHIADDCLNESTDMTKLDQHVCIKDDCLNKIPRSYKCKFRVLDENNNTHYIYRKANSVQQCNEIKNKLKTSKSKVWFDSSGNIARIDFHKIRYIFLISLFLILIIFVSVKNMLGYGNDK